MSPNSQVGIDIESAVPAISGSLNTPMEPADGGLDECQGDEADGGGSRDPSQLMAYQIAANEETEENTIRNEIAFHADLARAGSYP